MFSLGICLYLPLAEGSDGYETHVALEPDREIPEAAESPEHSAHAELFRGEDGIPLSLLVASRKEALGMKLMYKEISADRFFNPSLAE